MNKKMISILLILLAVFTLHTPSSYATGGKEATASLFLPTTGQAMNGELGKGKTKLMAGVEVVSIALITTLGIATGGGIVWVGLAPLIGNHVYSSVDAYKGAKNKKNNLMNQREQTPGSIEMGNQNRYDRVQPYRSDLRERMIRARQETEAQY